MRVSGGGEDKLQSGTSLIALTAGFYARTLDAEFRQGEIISGLNQHIYDSSVEELETKSHPFVVIASQDCDLLQDHNNRAAGNPTDLNSILCYEAHPAPAIRASIKGSDIWKRIVQNKDDRYHALQSVPPECDTTAIGLPDLIIDFKRFFCVASDELTRQIGSGVAARRTRLETPYKEHFQSRAAFYLQRVGLPNNHQLDKL